MERKTRAGLCFIAVSLFFFAGVLLFISNKKYIAQSNIIPENSMLGPFAIGGLPVDQAVLEPEAFFRIPLELKYKDQLIRVDPDIFDFKMDVSAIENNLQAQMNNLYSRDHFISYLFGKFIVNPINLELITSHNQQKIRDYLEKEITPRYDKPAKPRQPIINGIGFYSGESGYKLDIETAVTLIEKALISPNSRSVDLPVVEIAEPQGEITNLEIQLMSIIDQNQDQDQITEIVLIDPNTDNTFDFARKNQTDVTPEISFTAASTIKIPIMVSSYRRMDSEPDATTRRQLELMITESKNDQTDWIMENVIGGTLAPLTVTKDMRELGFQNIFLAGYFYLGAPLLDLIETPANTRTDIDLKPDVYNQTTARDMAALLYAIYQCDKSASGILIDTFKGEITQPECTAMIDLLKNNHLPYLISAGVPDGVVVAHKHGWIEESDGLLHTMSNVGVVYSPHGDYVLSIFTYHPENLIFEDGNRLFSQISTAVYDYFNPTLAPSD